MEDLDIYDERDAWKMLATIMFDIHISTLPKEARPPTTNIVLLLMQNAVQKIDDQSLSGAAVSCLAEFRSYAEAEGYLSE